MLPLSIALRFLRSSKGQTVLIVLGIAVGVTVQVFVGTLLQALQQNLVEQTVGNAPHITVLPSGDLVYIEDWEPLMQKVQGVKGVKHISPTLDSNALINTASNRTFPGLVRGMDIDRSNGIYGILGNIYEGSEPDEEFEVLLGRENSEDYGLEVGNELHLVLSNGSSRTVTVSGLFDLGSAALNRAWVITDLATSQMLFDADGKVTSIEMQVDDVFSADATAEKIYDALSNRTIVVRNWKEDNESLLSALSAQGSSSYMIQFFVLSSVMIGIASVLAITVMQKSKQIGILKAMGITNKDASLVFLFQGALLGLIGGTIGAIGGVVLFLVFTDLTGSVPPHVNIYYVLGSTAVAMIAATLAAFIPARRSARLDPMEVIRNA